MFMLRIEIMLSTQHADFNYIFFHTPIILTLNRKCIPQQGF